MIRILWALRCRSRRIVDYEHLGNFITVMWNVGTLETRSSLQGRISTWAFWIHELSLCEQFSYGPRM